MKYLYCLGEFDDGKSLSLRERGLKLHRVLFAARAKHVALLARAWIEISAAKAGGTGQRVALLARAWIEMRLLEGLQ